MVLLKISHWGPIIQHCNCFCFSRLFALCGWGMMMIWYHPFHHRLLQNLKLWPKKLEKIHEELFWWKRPNGSFVINSWRRVACSFLHNYTPSDAMHPLTLRSRRMMTNCKVSQYFYWIFSSETRWGWILCKWSQKNSIIKENSTISFWRQKGL